MLQHMNRAQAADAVARDTYDERRAMEWQFEQGALSS